MSTVYHLDQAWFARYPTIQRYERAPLPHEWPDLAVPPDAIVTVYSINAHCTVRVLALSHGPRVATVMDTNLARVVPLPLPPHVVPVRTPHAIWEQLA